ncbi:hypothetical protein BDW71DRAFT_205746 [Aspergillus fruticulosus]
MPWTLAESAVYRDELGGLEKVYRFQSTVFAQSGREHWGLYSLCTLSSPVHPDHLRAAWKALRCEVPALALTPSGREEVLYQSPTAENVEAWTSKTFLIEPAKHLDEILAEYPLRDLPALIYLEKSAQLLLLISHWRADALGCCILLNRLLELLQKPPDVDSLNWTLDLDRIPPCLEDAAGAPQHCTPSIDATTQQASQTFQEKAQRAMGIPYNGDTSTPPASPARRSTIWDERLSDALVTTCRERRITVTAAVYAALAQTVFDLSNDKESEEFATLMSVNMRPYTDSRAAGSAAAMRPYVSSITPSVPRAATFSSRTESLTQYFRNWHTEAFSLALREIYRRASRALLRGPSPAPPPTSTSALKPKPKPPSGITLSSLGVLDKYLSVPKLQGFEFGVSMLTRQMLLYAYTFRGRFHLSINYNSAYYSPETVADVLGRIGGTLRGELGLAGCGGGGG